LAKLAGLDPTAFNPSKRFSSDGTKPRWPSTESVAKALFAARVSFSDFAALATDQSTGRPVPLIGFAQAGNDGYFDDAGFPAGHGWDEIHFPGVSDHNAYALEIAGDSMAPVYRESDRIIVEPKAPIRRGDRVVVKTHQGGVLAKELGRTTAKKIELISLNKNYEDRTIQTSDVVWIGRIAWASQ
jgi:phage repressor protein C with HTH and peptisase S24 domain